MIAIVDYGMGNLRSVERAFAAAGYPAVVTADPAEVAKAERLVVPGVGAFADAMSGLDERGLLPPLREALAAGKPYLGICLGMQILFEESEEFGLHAGLGVLPGRVVPFQVTDLKVPHLGWNRVHRTHSHPVLAQIDDGAFFYFVHSFHVVPAASDDVVARTEYGGPFASVVGRGSLIACQFHPEKSQAAGIALLASFARWSP